MSSTLTLPSASASAASGPLAASALGASSIVFQCPRCGEGLSGHAAGNKVGSSYARDDEAAWQRKRIEELEGQVRILTERATTAVDRLADREDELQRLKNTRGPDSPSGSGRLTEKFPLADNRSSSAPSLAPHSPASPPRTHSPNPSSGSNHVNNHAITNLNNASNVGRFSSFLSTRRANPQQGSSTPSNLPTNNTDLKAALTREQALRQQAEGKLSEASGELEELSAQLFQQANEMVATERRARAKLEERVEMLERRDREKRKRLERLENAVERIGRVRNMLSTS
ncbi:MAG: hypothetical protein M1823_002405 [Watsoniomyces obsoletus]|nr:MAG: hypothetical protein M1823_002405 [Watsoniomyces obsoletus]